MKHLWYILPLLFILSCEDKKDTTPPEVTITSPTNGSKVNEVVTVSCMSTDNKEVSKVELWVDGVNTGLTDETEPYSFQWNTTTYKDGDHTLIVRGYDTSDNEGDSPPITVKVDNTISVPKGVSIQSAEFSNGGFTIKWSKSTDGDFKSYKLEHSVEPQMNDYEEIFSTEDVNATNTRMENTSPLTYHYFRVTVTDTFLYKTKGTIFTSKLDPIPDSVDVKSVTYDIEKMTVVWDESKEGDFGSYKLLYSKSKGGEKDTVETYTDKSTTSYSTTTFDPLIENWYWVIVSDTLGQSKIGNGKTNTIDTPPSSINIKSVTYDLEKMIVEWDGSSDWDFKEFSKHMGRYGFFDLFYKYPYKDWDVKEISKYYKELKKMEKTYYSRDLDNYEYAFLDTIDRDWDYNLLIDIVPKKFILEKLDYKWDLDKIIKKHFTMDEIKKICNYIDYELLSREMSLDKILDHTLNYPWDYNELSKRCITEEWWDLVSNNRNKPWNLNILNDNLLNILNIKDGSHKSKFQFTYFQKEALFNNLKIWGVITLFPGYLWNKRVVKYAKSIGVRHKEINLDHRSVVVV